MMYKIFRKIILKLVKPTLIILNIYILYHNLNIMYIEKNICEAVIKHY